jgi:hypothetical protein
MSMRVTMELGFQPILRRDMQKITEAQPFLFSEFLRPFLIFAS